VIDANAKAASSLGGQPVRRPDTADFSGIDAVIVCTSAYISAGKDLVACGYTGPIFYIYELFIPEANTQLTELEALAIDIAVTKNSSWPLFLLLKPQILVNVTFRLGNWLSGRALLFPFYLLAFLLHQLVCLLFSIQLPLKTPIGPGLLFAHYGTIVFTKRARIGSFFTIYHGCTVGTNDSGQGPTIGNFVYQYAGSHVLGRCVIGDRSRVGANAVVLDMDCPAESTLVGVPARFASRP
jgi:serine O-acetyltransferase